MSTEFDFPQFFLVKWQKLIDLLSSTFDLPATLIMQVHGDSLEVFAKSKDNPCVVGSSEKLFGLYCESVIKSGKELLVPNALIDSVCDKNPDTKPGMIAYLGYPIKYPNGEAFGTLCVLDNKENAFSGIIEGFLLQVRDIIELDISAYYSYEKTSRELEKKIVDQSQTIGLKKKSIIEIEAELDKHKHRHKILAEKLSYFNTELSKRENKYETLFSSMNSALVVFEPIFNSGGVLFDARYVDMNANNEAIIGYKKEDVVGKTILDVFPETADFWFAKFDFVVKNNEALRFDYPHKPLGKYFSLNAFPIEDNRFAVSYHDISDQEMLKQKLCESELRYKNIFYESSSIMMLVNPVDGAILDANSAAIRFYGYSKEKLLTLNMNDINVTPNIDLIEQMNWATQKKKNYFLFKHRLSSGEIRDVEVYSGQIKSDSQEILHSVIHDVTDTRKALEEVNRLSNAVEQSPVSVVITSLKGDIQYCNPKHFEQTGYTSDEMLGVNPRIFKSGKSNNDFYCQLWNTILAGEKWVGEFFNKKKDGSFYWESASITPIKDKKGNIVNFLKIGGGYNRKKTFGKSVKPIKIES